MSDFAPPPEGFELDPDDFDKLVNGAMGGGEEDAPAAEADAGGLAGKWVVETLADAYADNTPIEFIVDGLIPVPSLSIVYGGPGTLKSMLLADLAVCVAAGTLWLQRLDGDDGTPGTSFRTKQSPVLWLDFDNGAKRTRQRMAALGRGHEQPGNLPLHYLSMPMPWLEANDRSMMIDVAKYVKHHGYRMLIVDNLGLVNGGTDENSSEMAQVMGLLRWLSEEAGCAVIVVHHQRKSSGGSSSDVGARKGDSLRGHSTIEASLDMALLVERKGIEDTILVIPTKTRDYHKFSFFGAVWTYEHYADDSYRLRTGRFWARSVATGEEGVNLAIIAVIKNEMRGKGWIAAKDVADLVRDRMAAKPGGKPPGTNKVRGLLRQMAEDGQLFKRGETKSQEYSLS